MIAVIFEVEPVEGRLDDYLAIAEGLRQELTGVPGFLSVERFRSLVNPDKYLSLSFWESEQAVADWRNRPRHREGQKEGRAALFARFRIRVAGVLRDYGLDARETAPEDSRVLFG